MLNALILVILGTLISNSFAIDNVQVGVFQKNEGKVFIQEAPAEKNKNIYWGDEIITSTNSSSWIILFPNLSLKINSNSKIKIIGNLISKNGKKVFAQSALNLIEGKITERLSKSELSEQDIKIFSNRSISSIRGTEFIIENTDERHSRLLVVEGLVNQENENGQADISINSKTNQDVHSLIIPREVASIWDRHKTDVLTQQSKQFVNLKNKLQRDVSSITSMTRNQIIKTKEINSKQGKKINEWI